MKLQLTKRACPTCKEPLDLKFFSVQNSLVQCPKCRSLVRHKIMWIGPIIYVVSALIANYIHQRNGGFSIWGIIILLIALLIPLFTRKYEVIKRDFKIRNKLTNQITYVNHSDWEGILALAKDKELNFEIVEDLR